MELSFKKWGPEPSGHGRITLLHGMGGTGSLWRPLAAGLEEKWEVVAVDQRGHGSSIGKNLKGFSPEDYGRDLLETLDALDQVSPVKRNFLLGHSMGVRTAVAAAHLDPSRFEGLILIDLGFYGQAGGGLGTTLSQFLKILPETFSSRNEAREFMERHCPDPSIGRYLMAVSALRPDGSLYFPFQHDALISTIEAVDGFSIRPWIEALLKRGVRILALRGEKSLVWSQKEYDEEVQYFSSYSNMIFRVVAGASHGLPFEKRGELLQLIQEFVGHS